MLHLKLLGTPEVRLDGQPVGEALPNKAQAILFYLATIGQPQTRSGLASLLWGDMPEEAARANLRKALAHLRQVLGDHLVIDRRGVGFSPASDHWVDLAAFSGAVQVASARLPLPQEDAVRLRDAVALYRGDFLTGFSVLHAPEFDDWMLAEQTRLRELVMEAVYTLAAHYTALGELSEAIAYTRHLLRLEPWREEFHRQLMLLLARDGQRGAALAQYQACRQVLAAELGVEPGRATVSLYEAIRAGEVDGQVSSPPGATAAIQHPGGEALAPLPVEPVRATPLAQPMPHLPAQPTSFIGREREIADIRRLVVEAPSCRLITLLGPGGIGKTRLALAVAAALADAFPQGAAFVPLAALNRAEAVAPAVAEALRLNLSAVMEPEAQLFAYLSEKQLLLVLDNFEQLIAPQERTTGLSGEHAHDGTAFLAGLLRSAPQVVVLVTSRERLNLQEEWAYDVQGMGFPAEQGTDAGLDPAQLKDAHGAVQLFAERACQADPSFTLTAELLPHVVRICQLVEGMPLGLELAASWTRAMTCQEIATEIARSLDFLTASVRNLPQRHRSLRAVFEQTWQRLTNEEQRALSKLSVFRGGCLRHAAEAVADATPSLLAALVDKALLRRTSGGRYELHQVIQQYAAEQLERTIGAAELTRASHARYYAALLKQREAEMKGARQLEAVRAIATELDNVRAAWRWAVESADLEVITQAQQTLYLFYEMQGQAREGVRAFEAAATALRRSQQRTDGAETLEGRLAIGQVIGHQGFLTNRLGLFVQSLQLMGESVALLREVGPSAKAQLSFSLRYFGGELYFQGRPTEARQLLWESLTLATEVGDYWLIGLAWLGLGQVAEFQGEYGEAVSCFSQSIEAFRRTGERRWRAYALNNWGRSAYAVGAYQQAQELIGEALEIREQFGDRTGVGYSLLDLGKLMLLRGQYAQGRAVIQQSLALCEQIGDRDQVARCMNGLGAALRLLGQLDQAEIAHRSSLEAYQEMDMQREIPFTLACLGQVAYARGDYTGAEKWFLESLRLSQKLENPGGTASALRHLGHAAGATGRTSNAQEYYREALGIVTRTGAVPVALDILFGWATLQGEGKPQSPANEQILALLWMAAHHPAAPFELKDKALALLHSLGVNHLADSTAAVKTGDESLDWLRTAQDIIDAPTSPLSDS